MELGLQLALAVGRLPRCWALTPVHTQGTSGSGGIHAALSKGNRTYPLSARSCCCTARLEHRRLPCRALAFPCSSTSHLPPSPGSAPLAGLMQALPTRHLWCVGHGAEELPRMPPETSSTALPWHSLEGELLGSDPHTRGLLQQQPGEPGGLFYPQLGNGRMGVFVGWSVVLLSGRDQSQFSHSFNDCPNICSQRVPVLVSQLFGGEAKLPPVPNPQLLAEAMLPQ